MSTFVLVHGSWHDGSAWQAVVDHRSKRTSGVYSHDRGSWKGVDKTLTMLTMQSIVDYIVSKDLTDIVLLGHSFAGTTTARVAEAIPDRIRRLIFLPLS